MKRIKYKLFLYVSLFILIVVSLFQIYLYFFEKKIYDINGKNLLKIKESVKKDSFNVAVIGGISNNNYTWEDFKEKVKTYNVDFVISLGDFIFESSESNYRQFFKMLKNFNIPFISCIGKNEFNDGRAIKFINYFGPEFFSFEVNDNLFIFLDTTKNFISSSQKIFLEELFEKPKFYKQKFIFMNKAPFPFDIKLRGIKDYYLSNKGDQKYLKNFIEKHFIDAVFIGSLPLYYYKKINNTSYFISGGGGRSLISNNRSSFYHFILFSVNKDSFNVKPIEIFPIQKSFIKKLFYSIWFKIYSYLYVNMFNLIMLLAFIFFTYSFLFLILSEDIDYYANFMFDYSKLPEKKFYSIAMFTDSYFPAIGGVPISIHTLAEALIKKGHIVYIFAPEYNKERFGNFKDPDYVIRIPSITNYKKRGKVIPIANIFSKKIKKKIEELDIDVIHSHHPFWVGFKGNAIAKNLKLPSIYTYHTRYEKYAHNLPAFLENLLGYKLTHWFIKYFSQRNDAIFSPTNDTKKYLRSIGVSKEIFVIPTGVDINKFNNVTKSEVIKLKQEILLKINSNQNINQKINYFKKNPQIMEKFILFTVSRLDKEKNIYFIIEAISYIKENTNKDILLLVAGDGPEKNNLIKYVQKHNLDKIVFFLGMVDQRKLPTYYKMVDLFVFASTTETQGIVLLEAMAGNNPVVCIKSSGTNDLVEDGYNGYKTEHNIVEWSQKVLNLIEDKNLRNKISKNAYKFVLNYTSEIMAEKAIKVYDSLYKRKVFIQKILKK